MLQLYQQRGTNKSTFISKEPMVTVRLLQRYYLFFLYAGIQSHQRNIRSTYRISDFSKFIISIHAACWPNLTTSAKYQLHNRTCCSVLSCNISNSVSPVLLQFYQFYILSKKNGNKKYVAFDFIQSSHSFRTLKNLAYRKNIYLGYTYSVTMVFDK